MSAPVVSRVLIVEDEAMLRSSMARSLGRLPNVEVVTAATLAEGLAAIDSAPPALILSDIDLPDRSGLELIGELGARQLRVPIVFISAYLTAYRAQIPRHAHLEVLEKPVGIDELREVVNRHLATASPSGLTPFGVPDFLQLAGLGRHSVVIEVRGQGTITVQEGFVWSAQDAQGTGSEAFFRLALLRGEVTCTALTQDPGPRTVTGGAEELLLEAARRQDEGTTPAPPAPSSAFTELELDEPVPPVESHVSERPTPIPGLESFDALWDQGVEALLARRFDEALLAFDKCNQLRPDDRRVLANLQRLQAILGAREGESS